MNSVTQFLRFASVGVVVTALHVAVTVSFVEHANVGSVQANVIAFSCATLVGWVLNTRWSFFHVISINTLVRYSGVTALGLLVTIVINAYCVHWGIRYEIGLSIVVIVVPSISFTIHRYWTYRAAGQDV